MQVSSLPSLPPAALRALPVPAQSKVMASAVVTVAAVGGGPVRSVVAAVPPAATTLAPAAVTATPASTAASKTGKPRPGHASHQQRRSMGAAERTSTWSQGEPP